MRLKTLAVLALFVSLGCQQPLAPTPQPNIVVTQTQTVGGGINPNAPSTQCLPSEETPIRVDLTVPVTGQIGQNTPIDATPKSAAGKRSDGCNILQGIAWTTSPPATCSVPNPSEFNTIVRCAVAGQCTLTASVPGRGASGSVVLVCQ